MVKTYCNNTYFRCEGMDISYVWVKTTDSGYLQLAPYTVFDEESDFKVKIVQFRHPEVENRESQIFS